MSKDCALTDFARRLRGVQRLSPVRLMGECPDTGDSIISFECFRTQGFPTIDDDDYDLSVSPDEVKEPLASDNKFEQTQSTKSILKKPKSQTHHAEEVRATEKDTTLGAGKDKGQTPRSSADAESHKKKTSLLRKLPESSTAGALGLGYSITKPCTREAPDPMKDLLTRAHGYKPLSNNQLNPTQFKLHNLVSHINPVRSGGPFQIPSRMHPLKNRRSFPMPNRDFDERTLQTVRAIEKELDQRKDVDFGGHTKPDCSRLTESLRKCKINTVDRETIATCSCHLRAHKTNYFNDRHTDNRVHHSDISEDRAEKYFRKPKAEENLVADIDGTSEGGKRKRHPCECRDTVWQQGAGNMHDEMALRQQATRNMHDEMALRQQATRNMHDEMALRIFAKHGMMKQELLDCLKNVDDSEADNGEENGRENETEENGGHFETNRRNVDKKGSRKKVGEFDKNEKAIEANKKESQTNERDIVEKEERRTSSDGQNNSMSTIGRENFGGKVKEVKEHGRRNDKIKKDKDNSNNTMSEFGLNFEDIYYHLDLFEPKMHDCVLSSGSLYEDTRGESEFDENQDVYKIFG